MKRLVFGVAGALLLALVVWIARNTYWGEMAVPLPMKGEAQTNPFYAAQRFAERLGGHTAWDRRWSSPPTDAVVVLSTWHWDLSAGRRQAIERWVEAGGRLVVDSTLAGSLDSFERWSGIVREYIDLSNIDESDDERPPCETFTETYDDVESGGTVQSVCDFQFWSFLTARTQPEWALSNARGALAMRVRVGKGSVTVINAEPFRYRSLFDADHGRLFVAATQFTRDDEIRFLSEEDHPSLLALLWQHGGPAVALALAVVALVLWRGWVRFGPLAAPPPASRRSLAEQICGSGQFALRHGGGESLHSALVRALEEAVSRRVPGYARLPPQERTEALSRLTGIDGGALTAAIHHAAWRRSQGLRGTLALLETARRLALAQHSRSSDGTD